MLRLRYQRYEKPIFITLTHEIYIYIYIYEIYIYTIYIRFIYVCNRVLIATCQGRLIFTSGIIAPLIYTFVFYNLLIYYSTNNLYIILLYVRIAFDKLSDVDFITARVYKLQLAQLICAVSLIIVANIKQTQITQYDIGN